MKCLKCQTENLETKKYCTECGAKLSLVCPSCQSEVQPTEKFCGECGHLLSDTSKPTPKDLSPKDLTFDEKLAKIQKYLPGNITEKILSQRERIEGERKQVTVLFVDTAGYTSLSEKLDPEEVYSLMDQVYEILIHKVTEYGGTVNEFTGDGIMALFGAPIALEDAPQRALRASLAIHREIVQFNERIRKEKPDHVPLRMRAGIHTGPVVVGTIGNDLRVSFTAMGDTVNLASRMEGLAEPGTTCVSEDTFKLTEGLFRFECLGGKDIKGKVESTTVYQVIAPSSRRTRFDVSAERGLTPFVGRERARELLLDAFERARQGRGQAVSIVSEAGMGKSRLLYEFRKAVLNENITFLEGKCLSFSRGVVYQPITDILKSNFDIQEEDGDPEIRKKVSQGLQAIAVEEGSLLPYFLELLSVKDTGLEKIAMSPEGKKEKTLEALKWIILKGSQLRPLVMAIEDLHWIDKTSEDTLRSILESIPGARILLIFTYRPEFVPSWGARSYHNQLLLNRLSNRESLFMATNILGREQIPPAPPLLRGDRDSETNRPPFLKGGGGDLLDSLGDVQLETALEEVILEKTEGVPFFVEEFIKSLKDLGFIERKNHTFRISKELLTIRIPSTIQDIIMARVDALPEGAKELLQVGSLIGREFGYALLKAVVDLPESELLRRLSILKDAELLYERGLFPDSTLVFKHALTMEVVYGSLLESRKKGLHEVIGRSIEEVFKDHLEAHCEALTYHYFAAGNFTKAADHSSLAAYKAAKRSLINEAILYTERTISSLERLPKTREIQEKIIAARTNLGLRFMEMNYFHEAGKAIEPIIESARSEEYTRRASRLYTIMGTLDFCVGEDFASAFKHLLRGLEIAEQTGDSSSQAIGSYWLSYALSMNCSFDTALDHLKRVIDHNLGINQLSWTAVVKALTAFLALFLAGRMTAASQMSSEAMGMAETSGDLYSKVFAYSSYGLSWYGRGHLESARSNLQKANELNEKINQFWWLVAGNYFLGEVFFYLGNYPEAIYYYEKAISALENKKVMPSWLILSNIAMARVKIFAGDCDLDLDSLGASLFQNKVKIHDGPLNRYMAQILMKAEPSQPLIVEGWILKAISADESNRMQWHLGTDHALYAEFLKRKGDLLKSRENLGKAITVMKECGADGWVERYEREMALILD
jgi:class 3 adenylate cyclase/tetratricopeptide (TPR) repeat protein